MSKMKKGKATWKPAALNNFFHKEDGYVYRMIRKDAANIAKKEQEGWEIVSGIQSPHTQHESAERINDGSRMTSVQEGHDWILGRIPEEAAEARREYFADRTDRRTKSLTAHLKKELKDAPVHGGITISSRKEQQVID